MSHGNVCTLTAGFAERLQAEVQSLMPSTSHVSVRTLDNLRVWGLGYGLRVGSEREGGGDMRCEWTVNMRGVGIWGASRQ